MLLRILQLLLALSDVIGCYSLLNTVESVGVNIGELSCKRPSNPMDPDRGQPSGIVEPSGKQDIQIYESFTLVCSSSYYLGATTGIDVDINPSVTCLPDNALTGATLQPLPSCLTEDKKGIGYNMFPSQVADISTVEMSTIGCWKEEYSVEEEKIVTDVGSCDSTALKTVIELGCLDTDTELLVGYSYLRSFSLGGNFGEDIREDTDLTLKIGCVSVATSTICKKVNEGTTKTKLYVSLSPKSSAPVQYLPMNIDTADMTTMYKFKCEEGYNFKFGVDETQIYGYCTVSGGEAPADNEFRVTEKGKDEVLECYAICPANPTTSDFKVSDDMPLNFNLLFLLEMKKGDSKEITQDFVYCDEGSALSADAPQKFGVDCTGGPTSEEPFKGKLECDPCPVCYETCPVNPGEGNLEVNGNMVQSLNIEEATPVNKAITVFKTDVICKTGYALAEGGVESFEFTCSEGGKYTCATCPECRGNCKWRTDEALDFTYVNGNVKDATAIPGISHVEAVCKNPAKVLVGPRFLSCHDKAEGEELLELQYDKQGYPEDIVTTCETDVVICTKPDVVGGTLDKTGNIKVGANYTVICKEDHLFDMIRMREYSSYEQATFRCTAPTEDSDNPNINSNLPGVTCYEGCKPIEEFEGNVLPTVTEEDQAPYSDGVTVTFTCPVGYILTKDDKEQVCQDGAIEVPSCGKAPNPTAQPLPSQASAHNVALLTLLCFLSRLL